MSKRYISFSGVSTLATLFCASLAAGPAPGMLPPRPAGNAGNSNGPGTSALGGGDMQYSRLESNASTLQSFSLPIILPLEASLGRLSVGSSVEYVRREYRSDSNSRTIEGPGYFSLDGRFRAFQTGGYRLDLIESVNVPLSKERERDLPPEAWLSTGGYILDSGLIMSYAVRRAQISFDLQHSWKLANREYDPGESVRAALIFGFGFGNPAANSLTYRWPVSVTLGVTSHYSYADRINREVLEDTERGALFVSPGVTYLTNSVNLWADLEIPFYQLRTQDSGYEERMRGRIGMRYFFE